MMYAVRVGGEDQHDSVAGAEGVARVVDRVCQASGIEPGIRTTPTRALHSTLGPVTYAVRVVRVALDRHAERLEVMARDLAEDERDVAPPTARARAAARAVLGSMLGLDPTTLQIARECTRCGDPSHGKPRL